MQGTVDWIDLYGSFGDVMFWINPFSKETLDQETLAISLRAALCLPVTKKKLHEKQEKKAAKIVEEVLSNEEFYSKTEVRQALVQSFTRNGYKPQAAEEIAGKIEIRQKARPLTLLFSKACLTTVDLAGNVLALQKWGVADLSKLTAKIGSQSRVFLFIIDLGAETALGTIASAALIVTFSEAAYRVILQALKMYRSSDPTHREEAYQELQKALLAMLANGTDLAYTAAPLLFTLNPPAVVALAIVAKGTALICILIEE